MISRKGHRNRRLQTGGGHEGSWAVSYVDMLTLLLCFFIVFFNSDKMKVKNSLKSLQQIKAAISSAPTSCEGNGGSQGCTNAAAISAGSAQGSPAQARTPAQVGLAAAIGNGLGTVGGSGDGSGPGAGTEVGTGKGGIGSGTAGGVADGSNLKEVIANIQSEQNLFTQSGVKDNVLEIRFDNVSFFESGSNKLTAEGYATVMRMIKVLMPYKDHIRVVVQGHTDSRAVKHKKQASDNWELSVIRATAVLKVFNNEGFPQGHLSAEGFADTKMEQRDVASVTPNPSKEDLAKQRRITLRVEELKP